MMTPEQFQAAEAEFRAAARVIRASHSAQEIGLALRRMSDAHERIMQTIRQSNAEQLARLWARTR